VIDVFTTSTTESAALADVKFPTVAGETSIVYFDRMFLAYVALNLNRSGGSIFRALGSHHDT
jgi:hypothetical protein